MSRDDYIQHAHRHGTAGTDPIDLTAVAAGLTQMGGAVPWFEAHTEVAFGSAGTTSIATWGTSDTTVQTTDNPDGITSIVMAGGAPQAYTDGTYFAFDYVGDDTAAVEIITPGVYYFNVDWVVGRNNITTTTPFQMAVGLDARTSLTDQQVASAQDSRLIDKSELDDRGASDTTGGELGYATVHTNAVVYVGVATKIYLSFLREGVFGVSGMRLSVFRVSDSGGFTSPGSGGGIRYDFANTGDWLQVAATGNGASVTTAIDTLSAGIGMVSQGGNLVLGTTTGGGAGNDHVYIDSAQDIYLRAGADGNVYLDGQNDAQLYLNHFAGGINVVDGGFMQLSIDGLEIDSTSGISINQGNTLDTNGITISDNGSGGINFRTGAGGDLVLQIQADGTIHARTGGSIHFDLP